MIENRRTPADGWPLIRTRMAAPLRIAGRLLAIAGLSWAGWSAAQGWSDLLRPAIEPKAASSRGDINPPDWIAAIPVEGSWLLGGEDQPTIATPLAASEVEARLNRLPSTRGTLRDTKLLPLIQAVGGPGQSVGSWTAYSGRRSGLAFRAFTRGTGASETLISASLALRTDEAADRWLLLEPGLPEDQKPDKAHRSLLPLPRSVERIAARLNRAGQVVAEVIGVPGVIDDCLDSWRRAGWTISGSSQADSGESTKGPTWQCASGSERVQIWATARRGGSSLLFLVREFESGESAR